MGKDQTKDHEPKRSGCNHNRGASTTGIAFFVTGTTFILDIRFICKTALRAIDFQRSTAFEFCIFVTAADGDSLHRQKPIYRQTKTIESLFQQI